MPVSPDCQIQLIGHLEQLVMQQPYRTDVSASLWSLLLVSFTARKDGPISQGAILLQDLWNCLFIFSHAQEVAVIKTAIIKSDISADGCTGLPCDMCGSVSGCQWVNCSSEYISLPVSKGLSVCVLNCADI